MTTTHGYYDNKDQVLKRLKRAEGQVRGIARMVEEDQYCIDVKHCMTHITDEAEQNTKADELANAIGRMLSR